MIELADESAIDDLRANRRRISSFYHARRLARVLVMLDDQPAGFRFWMDDEEACPVELQSARFRCDVMRRAFGNHRLGQRAGIALREFRHCLFNRRNIYTAD